MSTDWPLFMSFRMGSVASLWPIEGKQVGICIFLGAYLAMALRGVLWFFYENIQGYFLGALIVGGIVLIIFYCVKAYKWIDEWRFDRFCRKHGISRMEDDI